VALRGVTKRYPRGGTALDDVSFRLHADEFAFLTGPSGAGKTTTLKLIHMEELPTDGEVKVSRFSSRRIGRREIPALRRRVSYVFQDFRLLDRLTAGENVAFALQATGADARENPGRVEELLGQVDLGDRLDALPSELSGGERQRVAIARALATEPLLLLADEPTGNLDARAAAGVMRLFQEIHDRGTAVLMATHDADLIRRHPDVRVIELEDGRLVYDSARSVGGRAGADGSGP
jgi:cell division transport system ATP-binding protein